jgi:hypothetical protein
MMQGMPQTRELNSISLSFAVELVNRIMHYP